MGDCSATRAARLSITSDSDGFDTGNHHESYLFDARLTALPISESTRTQWFVAVRRESFTLSQSGAYTFGAGPGFRLSHSRCRSRPDERLHPRRGRPEYEHSLPRTSLYERQRGPRRIHPLFRKQGAPGSAVIVARADQRSDRAAHQRRHAADDALLPRSRIPARPPALLGTEVLSHRRYR